MLDDRKTNGEEGKAVRQKVDDTLTSIELKVGVGHFY